MTTTSRPADGTGHTDERMFVANFRGGHSIRLFCTMNSSINPRGIFNNDSKLMILEACISTVPLRTALDEHEENRKSIDALARSIVGFAKENGREIVLDKKLAWLVEPINKAIARESRVSKLRLGME